ncbi:glycoside hydrolase family 6 protein [Frondihabitans cladoniiphilus]|uniref:Glucanase n=1 Tax=Frondihabitans cladoniiphilus TaxID=715785 RepID=A0ABP8W721_9MICO
MPRLSRAVLLGIVTVSVATTLAAVLPATADATPVTSATVHTASSSDVFGAGPYLVPNSSAAQAAASLKASDAAGSAAASTIAQYPVATWLGEWYTNAQLVSLLNAQTSAAAAAGTTPVFVTYAIPNRDCGGYSGGGLTATTYSQWTDLIASTLAGKRAVVIVEPDALAMLSTCTSEAATRYGLIKHEVQTFAANGIASYIDAGNSHWVDAATMATRLQASGIADARGFASNVSNYYPTSDEQTYDNQVSALTGGAHYVIDTSRNGQGYKNTWCNGPGAGLGAAPRTVSDGTALDALLWVKTPGASDGTCNGAPAAGSWYSTYAQALVANAVLSVPVGGGSTVTPPITTPPTTTPPTTTPPTTTPVTTPTTGSQTATALTGPLTVLANTAISSAGGAAQFVLQGDGNLVLYSSGRAVWSSGTSGNVGATVVLQSDGNMVLYSATGRALWNSGTSGRGTGEKLTVSDQGQATLSIGGTVVWQSPAPVASSVTPTATVAPGQKIADPAQAHQLVMQGDGNLVLYSGGRATWNSQTSGNPGARLVVQGDGNIVVYSASNRALWNSSTAGAGSGIQLVMQSDGNLVTYRGSRALWNSGTSGQ